MMESYKFGDVDTRPLYLQAVAMIKEYLEKGGFKANDALPPEAILAPRLGVSRSTLREAMGLLEREGLVIRRQGIGTFYAGPPGPATPVGLETLGHLSRVLRAHGQTSEVAYHEISMVSATSDTMALFQIGPESELVRVQHVLASNGERVAFFDTICPAGYVDDVRLLRDGGWSLFEYLVQSRDRVPAYATSVMHAINADSFLAERLNVAIGLALMQFQEVHYTAANEPTSCARNYYVTDRFGFSITRRVDPTLDRETAKRR